MDVAHLPALLASLASPVSPQELASNTALVQGLYATPGPPPSLPSLVPALCCLTLEPRSLLLPGFYNSLQIVALDANVPRDARMLAGLIMKNEMVGRWRGRTSVSDHSVRFLALLIAES